jgi:hypothetical protein
VLCRTLGTSAGWGHGHDHGTRAVLPAERRGSLTPVLTTTDLTVTADQGTAIRGTAWLRQMGPPAAAIAA